MTSNDDTPKDLHRIDSQLLWDMWIFRSAAQFQSVTAAGKRLGVTQGAVSQRVLRLEARLGKQLFTRKGGRLLLTEAGQTLFEAMNTVSVTLGDALSQFDRGQRHSLTVSCLPSLATEWLVPHLDGFYADYPGIELFIRAELMPPTAERIADEGIDVLIAYQQDRIEQVQELACLQEVIVPVCSRDYRIAMTAENGMMEIVRLHDDVPWVGGPRNFEWNTWVSATPDWQERTMGERHFNLANLAYHAALCGQGVAIGRAVLVNRLLERGELIVATDRPAVAGANYRIVSGRPGPAGSAVRKFAAWLLAEMTLSQQRTLEMIAEPAL